MTLSYSTVQYKVVQVLKNTFPHHHRQAGRQKIAAIKYVYLIVALPRTFGYFFVPNRVLHTLYQKKVPGKCGFFLGGEGKKESPFSVAADAKRKTGGQTEGENVSHRAFQNAPTLLFPGFLYFFLLGSQTDKKSNSRQTPTPSCKTRLRSGIRLVTKRMKVFSSALIVQKKYSKA